MPNELTKEERDAPKSSPALVNAPSAILPLEFTRNGWNHVQIMRAGHACVYRRWRDGGKPHLEVILVTRTKETEFPPGVIRPAGERYPSSEDWGSKGWTYNHESDAMKKFEELSK